MRIGYRSGDLSRKADTITEMISRSTGYFGTGYYFCTKPEYCAYQARGQRPIYRMTFDDNIKWFRGTKDKHDALKMLHRYLYQYPLMTDDLESTVDFVKELSNFTTERFLLGDIFASMYDYAKEEYGYSTWKEYYHEEFSLRNLALAASHCPFSEINEFAEKLREPDLDAEWFNDFQEEYKDYFRLDTWENRECLQRRVIRELPIEFGLSRDLFQQTCDEVYKIYQDCYVDGYLDINNKTLEKQDSLTTVFLKILGYQGVWPSPEVDNTEYGGVIFDKDSISSIELFAQDGKKYVS